MNDYNKIMRESGETFFKQDHPTLSAQKQRQLSQSGVKGPLSQMIAAGNQVGEVRELKVENEQLKAMIEIMQTEMQQVL